MGAAGSSAVSKEEPSVGIIRGGDQSQSQSSQHQEQLRKVAEIIPTLSLDLPPEAEEIFIHLRRKKPVSECALFPRSISRYPEREIKFKTQSESKSKFKPSADETLKREIKDLKTRVEKLMKCRAHGQQNDDDCQLCKNDAKISSNKSRDCKILFMLVFVLCLNLVLNAYFNQMLKQTEMETTTPAGKPQPDLQETIKKIIQENLKENLKELYLDIEKKYKGGLKFASCSDATEVLPSPRSKKQTIYPHGNGNNKKVEVLCDFETDGGGWTIIQKRSRGPREEFNRNWDDYANGFGSLDGNFWIGLENIHTLTQNGDQELRIDLEDFEGEKRWAKYLYFSISDASDFYRLTLGGFSGNAGNSFKDNPGMRFSTKDKDNDKYPGVNCAAGRGGGWWFDQCGGHGLLNGLYREEGEDVLGWKGIMWTSWKEEFYSVAKTEMKIRKRR